MHTDIPSGVMVGHEGRQEAWQDRRQAIEAQKAAEVAERAARQQAEVDRRKAEQLVAEGIAKERAKAAQRQREAQRQAGFAAGAGAGSGVSEAPHQDADCRKLQQLYPICNGKGLADSCKRDRVRLTLT